MKVKITRVGVTSENGVLPVGFEMTVPDTDGERLVRDSYAVEVEEEAKAPGVPPTGDTPDAGEGDDQDTDLNAKIDKAYKADELKAKAVEMGMEPKADVTKKDLIQAIVDAGLAEAFLQ